MSTLSSHPWPPRTPLRPVVALHVNEARARWQRRQLAQHSRELRFAQQLREDELLLAHMHGVATAGAHAQEFAEGPGHPSALADHFVRTWVTLSTDRANVRRMLDALNALVDDAAALQAACSAMGWAPAEWQASVLANQCLLWDDGPAGDALLRLCGHKRWAVEAAVLNDRLNHPRNGARRAAFEYCASMAWREHMPALIESIGSAAASPTDVNTAAAAAAFRLGERKSSVPRLLQVAITASGAIKELDSQEALVQLCVGLPLQDSREAWHQARAAGASAARLVAAAEASNDPAHLTWLLLQLAEPTLREHAEAALVWLTGFEIKAVISTDSDDYVAADVQSYLARQPLPASVDTRWLAGAVLNQSGVFDTLLHGPLRYRHHAARHLAYAAPHQPLVCLEAPAADQLGWLYEAESALEGQPRDAELACA